MVRGENGLVSVFQYFSTSIGSALILAGGWALGCRSIGLGRFRGFLLVLAALSFWRGAERSAVVLFVYGTFVIFRKILSCWGTREVTCKYHVYK